MSSALRTLPLVPRLPQVPWRSPHALSPTKLADYIHRLEEACAAEPQSADLRTCLGMAQAMNSELYKSMDTLEAAIRLDKFHFFARFKYAELFFRLRSLPRAKRETEKALDLAQNGWEISMARRQLQSIKELTRRGLQKAER